MEKNKTSQAQNIPADEFAENILKNVKPKSKILLGISGGPDSMYLLNRCLKLQKKLQTKLIVAHINHGLRGKASDGDERFVKKFCKKNKIPFHFIHLANQNVATDINKAKRMSKNLEEAGRDARYNFFENLRKQHKAEWILTAHHLNDNIETMLFNLIRGAHLNGIKAMEINLPSRHILRPMLGISKQEILAYLKKNKITYRLDASNENIDFSRNWLRKKIIPLFSKINPNFEQTFKETLNNFSQTSHYLEEHCETWLVKNTKNLQIELDTFLKEHGAFQKQLLVHLYKKIHHSTKKLTTKHLEEILVMLEQRQSNKKKEFGPHHFLEINKNKKGKRVIHFMNDSSKH